MLKNIPAEIAKLENRLKNLKARQLERLHEKLKAARKVVHGLEAEIASETGKALPTGRRKKTSSQEMLSRISSVLSKSPKGLTQKEISDKTHLAYGSVAAFLKKHQKEFRATGERKNKRYYTKGN